jgi:hypothetical protein
MVSQVTTDLITYYQNLLIKQYRSKPKARGTIGMFVTPVLMPQGGNVLTDNEGNPFEDNEDVLIEDQSIDNLPILPLAVQNCFNISAALGPTAQGVQMDIVAKYIMPNGSTRNGFTFSGSITLNDIQFLQLLQIMIARNKLRADLGSIQAFLYEFFSGTFQMFDHKTMRNSFFYLVPVGANILAEFFVNLGQLPAPLGVGNGYLIAGNPNSYFQFSRYSETPKTGNGFSLYAGAQIATPPLSYNNSLGKI